jgi:hypothetical protein
MGLDIRPGRLDVGVLLQTHAGPRPGRPRDHIRHASAATAGRPASSFVHNSKAPRSEIGSEPHSSIPATVAVGELLRILRQLGNNERGVASR